MYQVYAKINEKNEIYIVDSPAYIENLEEWIFIDEGLGEQYMYASRYFSKPIFNENGIYRYLYINDEVVERTDEEMAEELRKISEESTSENNESSLEERITTLEESLTNYELAYYQGVNEA